MSAATEKWIERLTIPAYRVGEAASYAQVSPSTVAAWHRSQVGSSEGLLSEKRSGDGLSFLQLIELAVVSEMRRIGIKMSEIKRARKHFASITGLQYPFAQLKFKTDGADILYEFEHESGKVAIDRLVTANRDGQMIWTEMLKSRLSEFDYGSGGAVIRWRLAGPSKEISIDPKLAFGAPQINGVRTRIVKDQWSSGETIQDIADDLDLTEQQVVEALLFEGAEASEPEIQRWIN